jgi:V-type H+-transporting ATPase subunit E
MKDADVSKQIQQMIRFIRQEAEEKANEISVSAEEVGLIDNILVKKF